MKKQMPIIGRIILLTAGFVCIHPTASYPWMLLGTFLLVLGITTHR